MVEPLLLKNFLPHEPPMLLLSAVLSVDDESASCETLVTSDLLFVDQNGDLPGWVGIELMAQTIAVWGGRHAANDGRGVTIGMLLGSRKYDSQREVFPAGARLVITAERVILDGNMGVFDCTISLEDKIVANAQVSTYLPGNAELTKILERNL